MTDVPASDRMVRAARLLQVEPVAAVLLRINAEPEEWDGSIAGDPDLLPQVGLATRKGMLEQFEGHDAWRLTEEGREVRSKILRLAFLTE